MFQEDSRTEAMLRTFGTKFRYTNDVRWAALSPRWKQDNWTRSVPINDEAVLQYAERTSNGSIGPAPILWPNPKMNDLYEVLDGVQRLCAAELLGVTVFSSYILLTDSEVVAATIHCLSNSLLAGDFAPTRQENMTAAVRKLILERQMSIEELARIGGWKKSDIQAEVIHQTMTYKLQGLGLDRPLAKGLNMALADRCPNSELEKHHDIIIPFLKTLRLCKFTVPEAIDHMEAFFQPAGRGTRRDQYSLRLAEFQDHPEVKQILFGSKGGKQSTEAQIRGALLRAKTAVTKAVHSQKPVSGVKEFFDIVSEIRSLLSELSSTKKARR